MRQLLFISTLFYSISIQAQVAPFLTTTWNQTCNYNALMPTVGSGGACGKAYTGCNATAIGQIFKYYAYPTSGFSNHCNSLSPSDCVDFEMASYNYAAMPNNVSASNMDVATLMYDIGVAVDMNWSGTNSTSFFSATVLKKYFAYSPKMYSTATFLFPTTADLIEGIKAEMDAGRPVFAKGGGHFYLIDGYNASNDFHMNFGWGGTYNGYYSIDNVTNGAGTFNPSNFIFNIMPMQGDLETATDTIYVSANGSSSETVEFSSQLDWTANVSAPWINLNLNSGSKGYFAYSEGSTFSTSVNNGPERTAYLVISNANAIDSVVIIQAESPLSATPNPVDFAAIGGVETIDITYSSGFTWNATTAVSWLTLTPNSGTGTGTGTFDITCDSNPSTSSRSAYVVLSSGSFVDSVLVNQEGSTLNAQQLEKNTAYLSPNPTVGKVKIGGTTPLAVTDVLGNKLDVQIVQQNAEYLLDLGRFPNGIYFIHTSTTIYRVIKKE